MPAPIMRTLPDLPADRRADLRYYCGFGCVRCGVTIYRYLALPPMAEPRNGNGGTRRDEATLLCPSCHDLVETERLTISQIHGFHANPLARQRHFARDRLPFTNDLPELAIGGSRAVRDTPIPLTVSGEPLLVFSPPRQGVGATRIGVRLGGHNGDPVQVVDYNEWLGRSEDWSFAHRGDRYVISALRGDSLAILRIVLRNRIAVEHLRTTLKGRRVEITADWIEIDSKRYVDRIPSGTLIGLDI